MSKTPSNGKMRMTAVNEIKTDKAPAMPKVRIRPDSENSSARNDSKAVPWATTHAGPTTFTANRTASQRVSPSRNLMRIADTICMLSAKPITMISGVMTLRKRLRRNPSQPSSPKDHTTASTGGNAATSINETRRKKMAAMIAPNIRPRPL